MKGFNFLKPALKREIVPNVLASLKRGDLFTVGDNKKVFLVFQGDEGAVTRFVFVHGTKHKKYYRVQATQLEPLLVGVFECEGGLGKVPEGSESIVPVGSLKVVGHIEAR